MAIARKLQEEGCQDLAKKLKEVLGEIEHKVSILLLISITESI